MKPSRTVVWLSWLIAALALVAASMGLVYQNGGSAFAITTLRGETVEMYGQGLYRYETLRDGSGFRGVDLFLIVVAIPLLLWFTFLYRRGSLKGGLLLAGTLAYFLYNATSQTFGYAYNSLFLVYLAEFSASLFACVLAFTSFDAQALAGQLTDHLPRRAVAGFLFVVGGSLLTVWLGLDILPAISAGKAPALTGHTTLPTHALDMGVIAPVAVVAGALVLRRAPLGYLLATTLLVMSAILGAGIAALSAAQLMAGALSPAETAMFVVPFVLLAAVGSWLTIVVLRSFADTDALRAPSGRLAHP
jgi:hypothetical protein